MKSTAGFTLIEVLIAMVVSMIILGGAYSVFISQQKNTSAQINVSDIQQNLRAAMDFMVRDIRMAGYAGTDAGATGSFGITDVAFSDYSADPSANGSGYVSFSYLDDSVAPAVATTVSYSLSNIGSDVSDVAPGSIALMRDIDGVRRPMAGYIINLGLAFAYDADQDGELDQDAAGNVIWAVDTDNDGDWDRLDTNGDGQINAADLGGGATTGQIAGTGTGTPLRYQDIRAVRIWMLGRSPAPDNSYTDNKVYIVGRDVVQPNDNFRHRLLERTVLCRNMGLRL